MSEAPEVLCLRQENARWHQTNPSAPGAVRYVRADLYEALQARLAVVRSWGEAPCLEPLEGE